MNSQNIMASIHKAELTTDGVNQQVTVALAIENLQLDVQLTIHSLGSNVSGHQNLEVVIDGKENGIAQSEPPVKESLSAKDIYEHVEQALVDYHRYANLCRNPLVHLLDISAYRSPEDNDMQASGMALRRLLDDALDAITGDEPDVKYHTQREKWRSEHYLHLRYRVGLPHKEIEPWMSYARAAIFRLRKSYIEDVADLMIHACLSHRVSSFSET